MDEDDEPIRCPKCGSKQIHADQRGWNLAVGFLGSGKVVITCLRCGNRFGPGHKQMVDWE
jgi:DNA-directed RNA polymerase subunit RPC12/RpoP